MFAGKDRRETLTEAFVLMGQRGDSLFYHAAQGVRVAVGRGVEVG